MLYDDFDDLPRDCEVPFENMSEDEFLYRAMNEEGPMYMEPVEDNIFYDTDEPNADDFADWD